MQVGTSGPWDEGMKWSTQRSKSQDAKIGHEIPFGKISQELSNEF